MYVPNVSKHRLAILLLITTLILGCGGGGGDKSAPSDPGVTVTPTSFDFGTVTLGNSPAALQVRINSTGTTALAVSSINQSGDAAFTLNRAPASNPCGTSATIAPGGSCTFEVAFSPSTAGSFSGSIQIATGAGTVTLPIAGASEAVNALTVSISQVTSNCTPGGTWTAYVSVTDQSGFPYAGLEQSNFALTRAGGSISLDSVTAPPNTNLTPISTVAVMDYSSSITDNSEIVNDMQEGLVDLINQQGNVDLAEIIKFDNIYEVVHPFSSDKGSLAAAIRAPYDHGADTLLWDTLYKAVDDAGGQLDRRRAIIILTDGYEYIQPGSLSIHSLDEVILHAQALDVPIFPVALGSTLNMSALTSMSEDTGGQLYLAPTSDSLRIAFLQLASMLFQNQYILEFSGMPSSGGGTDSLTVTIAKDSLTGASPLKTITLCP